MDTNGYQWISMVLSCALWVSWLSMQPSPQAMPNGFRHEVMIRRLALRLDGTPTPGTSLAVRVALRQEPWKVRARDV